MLRFFLDGIEVITPPKGANSLNERIYYSEDLWCNLSEITGNLIFMAQERDYIFQQWIENNCGIIDIEIQKPDSNLIYRTEFKGFIFLENAIFNDISNEVEVEITDNSFIALIDNNKNIEMNLFVTESKNGVDISGSYNMNSIGDIFSFSPGGGTYSNRLTISVYDAFAALIAFMTDATCDFESNFFNPSLPYTEGNLYYLVRGYELANGTGDSLPTISFQKLFTDMHRAFNLRIGIEESPSGKPLIRIEPKNYFRSSDMILLPAIKEISFQRKPGNEYTKILVGNDLSDDENTLNLFNYLWNTWKTKEYILLGQCNDSERELDLTLETLCADVRVISDVGAGSIVKDDEIFIYAEAGGGEELWNPFLFWITGVNYNNRGLTNGHIIDRWEDDIYSSVADLSYFNYDLRVERTTQQTITTFTDIVFDNESTNGNFDTGGLYNNATGIYDCYLTGTYTTRFTVQLLSTGGSSTFQIGFAFGFAAGPQNLSWYFPGQQTSSSETLSSGESATYELELEIPLFEGTDLPANLFPATISVQVNQTAGVGTLTVEPGSTFEIMAAGSGTFREFSANQAISKELTASGSIDSTTWNLIKQNRDNVIGLQGRIVQEGYTQDIERNIESGEATIKLLGRVY